MGKIDAPRENTDAGAWPGDPRWWAHRKGDWKQLLLIAAAVGVVCAGLVSLVVTADHRLPMKELDSEAIRQADTFVRALFVERNCNLARQFHETTECNPFPGYHLIRGSREVQQGCCVRYGLIGRHAPDAYGAGYQLQFVEVLVYDTDPPDLFISGGGGGGCGDTCGGLWKRRVPFASTAARPGKS